MTAPEPDSAAGVRTPRPDGDQGPVTAHRGGTVDVDRRRAGQVVIGVCLVALTVTGVVLLIAGMNNNSQINSLRHHGVPVTVSVTTCMGLMGGTGANPAGYACDGTYSLDGTVYRQAIPGLAFHRPGSTLQGVAVPGDPKLLSTPGLIARQHASWTPFIIPGLLLLVVVAVLVAVYLRRPRSSGAPVPDGTAAAQPR
jgi:hypothetical protein